MAEIHATAIIAPGARLADDVSVGPYSVIGEHVEIGSGTRVGAHAVITGHTRIGQHNQIFHFVSLGEAPQDKKYAGEPTRLEIGDHNVIREFCTFNTGTVQQQGVTKIGSHNWIMAYVHIAHDCQVGNQVIFSNSASLAGHVQVQDHAILGGFTLVHQFCNIGAHCFTAMNSVISMDVPPYVMVSGHMAKPHGLNVEGLKRRGFSAGTLQALRRAYKAIYRSRLTLAQAIEQLKTMEEETPEITVLVQFLEKSKRGIVR